MKSFDITYRSTRLGTPCVKSHRFLAENPQHAEEALLFWKGATKQDIISLQDIGLEVNPSPNFTIKV